MRQEEGDFVRQAIKDRRIRGPGDSPIGSVSQSELAPRPRSHPDSHSATTWLCSGESSERISRKRIPSYTECWSGLYQQTLRATYMPGDSVVRKLVLQSHLLILCCLIVFEL